MEKEIKDVLIEESKKPLTGKGASGPKDDAALAETSSPKVCDYTKDGAGLDKLCAWIQAHKEDILALTNGGTVFPGQSSESMKITTHVTLPGLENVQIPAREYTLVDVTAGFRAVYGASQWIQRLTKERNQNRLLEISGQLEAIDRALVQVEPIATIIATPAGAPLLPVYAPIISAALSEEILPTAEDVLRGIGLLAAKKSLLNTEIEHLQKRLGKK